MHTREPSERLSVEGSRPNPSLHEEQRLHLAETHEKGRGETGDGAIASDSGTKLKEIFFFENFGILNNNGN